MANVIVGVILTKGGVSKTTSAIGLGEAFTMGGGPVTVIDADPMGGSKRWADLAAARGRPLRASVVGMAVPDIRRRIHAIARDSAVVIIDGPPPGPGAEVIAESAMEASDIVVMPMPPRPGDMDRVLNTMKLADKLGKPSRVVLTQVRGGQRGEARLNNAIEVLEGWGVPMYQTRLAYSTTVEEAYGNYLTLGNPVMRYGLELMTEISTTEIGKARNRG